MNNYSGIIHQVLTGCLPLVTLSILVIIVTSMVEEKHKFRECIIGIVGIAYAVYLFVFYTYGMFSSNYSSYTGNFVESSRTSETISWLPFTDEYIFWNGEGKRQVFYLDNSSKEEIFPDEFKTDKIYTIYYDEWTDIILRVEVGKSE